jgi:uncharacterized protein YfaS (alpha-2-macroglobulin family)/TolA-binding protein
MNATTFCSRIWKSSIGLAFAVNLVGLAGVQAADSPPPLGTLRAEMRAGNSNMAVTVADQIVAAKGTNADEAQYLKALTFFNGKKYAEAIASADELAKAFPQSAWRFKAAFLKAQALVEQKQFQMAAFLYQTEAARLLNSQRKQELVGVIVAFADKLATKPDPSVPDAPGPDYQKAYNLYNKALTMEISRDLRDDLFFKKARAIQQAGNYSQAARDFQAYLTEFDPTWTGPAGSGAPRQAMQNPPPAGKHVAMAHFRLAESQIQSGNPNGGRMELEDLLKRISVEDLTVLPASFQKELASEEGKTLRAEIMWLLTGSYLTQAINAPVLSNIRLIEPRNFIANNSVDIQTIGNTGGLPTDDVVLYVLRNGELEGAVKACRDYIAAYPEGSRAVRAAWMIAEVYQNAGRAEDAIQAYRDFIAGKGFRLPEGKAAEKYDEELRAAPSLHLANLKMRAVYRIGSLLGQQKKRVDAIAMWLGYVKDFPNGPQWSASQNAIIEAEYQTGMDALAGTNYDTAVKRFEEFLSAHPLDSRAPRILYLFGAVHQAEALALEEAKGGKTNIDSAYRKAIEEWTKLVSKYPNSPEARIALMKSAKIHEEQFGEYEKALQLYRKLLTEFNYGEANGSIARLTQKSLDLSAERTFRTSEKAVVKLKLRNIEKCSFRMHKIDLQAYFRKMHGITGVEDLDVSLIQPDKTWDFKPEGYAKYKPFDQEVEIPFTNNEPGAYVVTAGDDDWESTVLVLRSDLEVIVKSSRREVLAFVQNMLTGKPAGGVDVLVSDGLAVAASGKTGSDGVFKTNLPALKDLANVRLFALGNGHAASYNLGLSGLRLSSGLTAKGYLYTDRPTYQPGETVSLRGILREVRNTSYAVPENSEFKVSVTDPSGRLLSEQTVKLNRFGAFDASLALPASAVNGQYVIAANQERKGQDSLHFQGAFQVRAFKLEKLKLSMEFPRRVWFRGETIDVNLQAAFYWGEPSANRILRCTLPDGRSQTLTTDAEGKAKLSFDTSSMTPGSALTFFAAMEGENVSANENVTLARLGFSLYAQPSQPVVLAGEPFDLTLTATGADGKPVGENLKVAVMRIEKAKSSRVMDLLPWQEAPGQPNAEVKDSEQEAKTDAATGKATLSLKLEKGGTYRFRATGTDRFGQAISTECAVEVSDDTDATKLRFFAESAKLKVGKDATVRLHSRLDKGLALLTFEGETILRYQILELKKDYNEIPVKVGHELFPNFRLSAAAMDGRELRNANKDFTVERELKVALKPIKEAFLPGESGQVEITVTDQSGQPVEAELSLALVNEALYSVHIDTTTPILNFFQQDARRFAEFKSGATCSFRYPGKTRPVSRDIAQESERVSRQSEESSRLAMAREQLSLADKIMPASAPAAAYSELRSEIAGRAKASLGGGMGGGRSGRALGSITADGWEDGSVSSATDADRELSYFSTSATKSLRHDRSQDEAVARREAQGQARWLPSIVTGADGKAIATIPMPETTTAWRLTARGCSVETLVGQAVTNTLTKKDFFVELKTPSFLREGDEVRVVGRIHNLTDYAGPVALKLRVLDTRDKTKVLAERQKTVDVKAKSGAEIAFDAASAPALLDLTFELTGTAGTNNDVLALDIPVKPWGLQYAAHAGGTAEADTAAVVELPAGKTYSSLWMSVAVGPDVRTAVLDMALRRGWVGLGESMSRLNPPGIGGTPADDLLATATALRYAQSGKVDETYPRQLADRARALTASLIASQTTDGTWTSQSLRQFTTARAFWALIEARNSGIVVNKTTLDKAAAALQKQFESSDVNDLDGKAMILHALSVDKRADYANCNRLYRDRNTLGNAALAYLACAFYNIDRKEIAAELATLLEPKVKLDGDKPLVWESGCKTAWLNDNNETTAMALLALAQAKPSSPVASKAADLVLKARGVFGFPTPRAHGPAVAALSAWFGQGVQQSTDLEIGVVVNGKEIGSVKTVATLGEHVLPVPSELLKAQTNLVEFKTHGRGRYAYAATLFGFSPDVKPTPDNVTPVMNRVEHIHAQLEYRGRRIGAESTSPVKSLENGQRVRVVLNADRGYQWSDNRYSLEIALPPGARLDENTLSVNPANWMSGKEIGESSITLFFEHQLNPVSFELTGYTPGKFRMLPPVIRQMGDPSFITVGQTTEITVLASGEKSTDEYKINDGERYALGKCYFDDGDYTNALEHLSVLHKNNPGHYESEQARMLLWIYTSPQFYDAHKIVDMFEVLRERYPQLEIPFEKILVVGRAYTDINEYERSWLVYRAAIAASFNNDSAISAVLEDEGKFLGSIDFMERVWREYPDTAEVVSSYFALSQLLFQKAPSAHTLPKEDGVQPERVAMLQHTAEYLLSFLAMYPQDPLADDAGFSLANCMLTLKDYPKVVSLGNEFAKRYPDSPLAPGFQYMTALGLFWQNQYTNALAAAKIVADGDSKDRDYARYILGQIYHAESKPKEAVEWYGKVKTLYPDASEAIAYFEKKAISLDEVSVIKPGKPVELTLKYRNIKEASFQVYRVDLMKLCLQQKNLSAITSVQLAGIRSEHEQTVALGDGLDYVEKERKITLPMKDEAAYLVICRGDDLFASGMVLITPLKIEVQEETASGRLRANVLDSVKGGYRPEVHVKAIGSADQDFRSGETDLRGLFIADNIHGQATVIAREGESRYAFFRDNTWMGAQTGYQINAPAATRQPASGRQQQLQQSQTFQGAQIPQFDYQNNLTDQNYIIQSYNNSKFNEQRRQAPNKGVQVQGVK